MIELEREKNNTVTSLWIHFLLRVGWKLESYCFLIVILIHFLISCFKASKTSNIQKPYIYAMGIDIALNYDTFKSLKISVG